MIWRSREFGKIACAIVVGLGIRHATAQDNALSFIGKGAKVLKYANDANNALSWSGAKAAGKETEEIVKKGVQGAQSIAGSVSQKVAVASGGAGGGVVNAIIAPVYMSVATSEGQELTKLSPVDKFYKAAFSPNHEGLEALGEGINKARAEARSFRPDYGNPLQPLVDAATGAAGWSQKTAGSIVWGTQQVIGGVKQMLYGYPGEIQAADEKQMGKLDVCKESQGTTGVDDCKQARSSGDEDCLEDQTFNEETKTCEPHIGTGFWRATFSSYLDQGKVVDVSGSLDGQCIDMRAKTAEAAINIMQDNYKLPLKYCRRQTTIFSTTKRIVKNISCDTTESYVGGDYTDTFEIIDGDKVSFTHSGNSSNGKVVSTQMIFTMCE